MPHTIRLRGPWQYQPLVRTVLLADGTTREEAGPLPPAGRIQMPADWGQTLGADFRGRVRYERRFQCPTGLQPGDRVELVLERIDAFGQVTLNEQPLGKLRGDQGSARFDIRDRLQGSNVLVVEVELPRTTADSPPLPRPDRENQPGGLVGLVWLEIRGG